MLRVRAHTAMKSSQGKEPVISPEAVGPPPRRIQLTANGITLAVVTAVIVAMAVVYACFVTTEAARQFHIRTELRSGSIEVMGKIEALRNPYHGLKEYVGYTFVANDKTFTGEAIVSLEYYHSVRLTNSLPI